MLSGNIGSLGFLRWFLELLMCVFILQFCCIVWSVNSCIYVSVGVEVKAGEPVKVRPDQGNVVHLSQVCLVLSFCF